MKKVNDILEELRKRTKKINPIDVNEKELFKKGFLVEYVYKSEKRREGRRKTFLYLSIPDSKKFVNVLLVTGNNYLNDPKELTITSRGYKNIDRRFKISPNIINKELSYDYIECLIRQCYEFLR